MTAAIIPMDRAAVELAEARKMVREADTMPEYMVVRSALVLLARGDWKDAERAYAVIEALGCPPTDDELAATPSASDIEQPGPHPDLWSLAHPEDWAACLIGVTCGVLIMAALIFIPYGFGWTP